MLAGNHVFPQSKNIKLWDLPTQVNPGLMLNFAALVKWGPRDPHLPFHQTTTRLILMSFADRFTNYLISSCESVFFHSVCEDK